MCPRREPGERERPERHPLERPDGVAHRVAHALDLALAALVDGELEDVAAPSEAACARRRGPSVLQLH
ncbi:MAG: hypothetical protein ACXVFO_15835, partial [Solirubrobacteraceae bacterium]